MSASSDHALDIGSTSDPQGLPLSAPIAVDGGAPAPRAAALGLVGCVVCGLVLTVGGHGVDCPRCRTPVQRRKPDSLRRTWALLIAAAIMYIPANLLPVLHSTKLFRRRSDTILSGVVELWIDKSYDLAVIVFTASIVVPILKIGAMALLLVSVQRGWHSQRHERARLYRVLEFIGHWSMLDVFALALLVALVRFGALAYVRPGSGIVAFGAVVVLTMLATRSFDPRLIWDDSPRARPPRDGDAMQTEEHPDQPTDLSPAVPAKTND